MEPSYSINAFEKVKKTKKKAFPIVSFQMDLDGYIKKKL